MVVPATCYVEDAQSQEASSSDSPNPRRAAAEQVSAITGGELDYLIANAAYIPTVDGCYCAIGQMYDPTTGATVPSYNPMQRD
ncbi:hypothetical protein PG997_004603 [Apiospora hydei]|uniref:Uncharacterized protein n=1 Tax=Apiospora hydei TaxID=1337664 RepID=A0ABR1X2R7_9PEZI